MVDFSCVQRKKLKDTWVTPWVRCMADDFIVLKTTNVLYFFFFFFDKIMHSSGCKYSCFPPVIGGVSSELSFVMFLNKFRDNLCPVTRKAVTVLSPYRQCQRNLHPSQINPLKLKHLAKVSLRGFRVFKSVFLPSFFFFFSFLSVKIKHFAWETDA